ncbi:MAG: site-specific DNA-methyltransferase [Bacteroidales bacterium]|nr:site-specific DNA-methyltransferase [Bacteroidales bacterium]
MEEEKISQLGKSETVIEQNIKSLKQLFPQVFTEDKINFSLLEDLLGEKIEDKKEYYELSWAGKSDARKELSKSTVATLTPDREKSVDFDNTQNLFIEGENLEVLRCLQKSYFGKIKMIYIDPPYNTGNDSFVYPDNYSETKKEYEKRIGKVDEEGYINKVELWKQNSKENGQYHSVWLSMMYSRLSYAHSLLSEDGVIFISIDDNEQANLKLLCDSIFGESNFVADIIWNSTKSVTNTALISISHTHTLVYFRQMDYFVKNRNKFRLPDNGEGFSNPDNDSRGPWKADPFQVGGWRPNQQYDIINPNTGKVYKPNPNCSWKNDFNKYQELVQDNRIVFGVSGEAGPQRKRFIWEAEERGMVAKTIWADVETTSNGTQLLKNLFDDHSIFDNPKPTSLIKRMMQLGTNKDSIILDFFAGSCTTGHAVMELNKEDGGNRKFICIQMPEKTDKKSEAYKQGYEKISDIGAERLRRAGKRIKEEIEKDRKENDEKLLDKKEIQDIDTGFKYYRLTPSHFKVWQNDINENELGKQLDAFIDATKEGSVEEEMLYELILKLGFSLTTTIEKNSKGFYYIKEWQTCIALENFNKETIESIFELKPKEVITLDKFFENNDSLLSNTRLEFKDKEIILTII